MQKTLTVLFLIASAFIVKAQTTNWARDIGASYGVHPFITADSDGNVYSTGSFNGTIDADPGAAVYNLTSNGQDNIFISKINKYGSFVWAINLGGPGAVYGSAITLDANGNILLAGSFSQTVDFDPGVGIQNLTAGTFALNAFILKLDSTGNYLWAKAFVNTPTSITGASGSIRSIHIDSDQNILTTGSFNGTVDFDPSATENTLTTNPYLQRSIFISKLDSAGNYIWAKQFGINDLNTGTSITTDNSGNILACGNFSSQVDFDPGINVFNLNTFTNATYILKLNANGDFNWVKTFEVAEPNNRVRINSITLDANQNIIIKGSFIGAVDLNPGNDSLNIISDGISETVFISKFDLNGEFIWAKTWNFNLPFNFQGYWSNLLLLNSQNSIYSANTFTGTIDVDPGNAANSLTSQGASDLILYKLDTDGNLDTTIIFNGKFDFCSSIVKDGLGNIIIGGRYSDTTYVATDSGIDTLNANETEFHSFILQLGVESITAIEKINDTNNITIYPNPTSSIVNIDFKSESNKAEISLYNLLGEKLHHQSINTKNYQLDLSQYSSGTYFISIKTENENIVRKVVKQ